MEDFGSPGASQLSPSTTMFPSDLLASYPAGADFLQEGPEVARRQAEWERQIESLDQKEMELHQTQLRLIRDQTSTFIRDLHGLRQEVATLKSGYDAKLSELKDYLEKERRERHAVHSVLQEKVAGIEGELPDYRDEVRNHVRDLKGSLDREQEDRSTTHSRLERKLTELSEGLNRHAQLHQEVDRKLEHHRALADQEREVTHGKVKDLSTQHAEVLSKVQATLGQDKSERQLQQGSFNDRLERLERELQSSLLRKTEKLESDVRELQHTMGSERRLGESREQLLADHASRLESHRSSVQDRLDYLEKVLGDSALEAQAARSKLDKLAASHGAMQQSSVHHASMAERLQYLEQAFGDSADKHEKDILQAKTKLEQLNGKLADHHSQLLQHASMEERMAYIEKLLGDSADTNADALTSAHTKIEQLHGRLAACERHGPMLHELQKSHSSLAVETASKHAHHASLSERLEYLETTLGDSADKHAMELEALKVAQAKYEALHAKHGKEIETMKGGQANHATLTERLNTVERAIAEVTELHNSELSGAHTKIDQLHGRVASCEANGSSLSELKKSHSNLTAEKASLESHHASLKERVDFLEGMLGDSADKHAKDLEGALVKLEQVHGRVAMCERLGHAVGDLQKSHAALTSEKTTLDAHHSSLKDRVEYLEQVLGDSADRQAKDLEALKVAHTKHAEELKSVRAVHVQHATIEERLNYVEKLLGDSADAHVEELAAAHAKLDQIHQRVVACEKSGGSLGDLKRSHAGLASEKAALESSHASLKERVDYLENMLGESADKHARGLEEAKSKLDLMHTRVNVCEKHGATLSDLQKDHDDHKIRSETHHASVRERVDYLETMLGDSADKHARELDALRAAHAKIANEAKAQHGRVSDLLTQEKEARDGHHASVQERLSYLEGLLNDSADKHERHSRAMEAQKAAHAKLANDLKTRDAQHAGLNDRLSSNERLVGEVVEKHVQELGAAHTKIDQLNGRLSEDRAAREAHGASIDNLKKSHASLANEKAMREQQHATMGERLEYLEKFIGESADKHTRELETLKVAHAKLASDARAKDSQHSSSAERIAQLAREKDEVLAHHASLKERVDYLEKSIGDSADRHERDIETVRGAHSKHLKELDALKKAQAHHATLKERLDYLEKKIDDSADRHTEEVAAAHARVEQLHGRLAEEKSSRERHHNVVGDQVKQEQRAREEHHASVDERLRYLESMLGDSADKHSRDLEAHKVAHAKLAGEVKARDANHASLVERLNYLESLLQDSADKHAQELATAHTKISQLHSRLGDERTARDAHQSATRDGLSKERETRDKDVSSMRERLDHLEGLIGEHAEKHSRELESHKTSSVKLANDVKTFDTHHATVTERLDYLEQLVGDSVRAHAGALEQAQSKLDQLHNRLASCEKHGSAISELQKSHGSLASTKTELDVHHSSLKERVEFLEGVIGDTADQHRKALETLKVEHSKLASDTRSRDVHHATMTERLGFLEKLLHDSADKHAQELAIAVTRVDQLHGRIASCEAQGHVIENLKKSHSALAGDRASHGAHNAVAAEKVTYLEKSLQDSHERHAQEIQAAHKKIDQLHKHVADDRAARDGHQQSVSEQLGKEQAAREKHHATVEERLTYLESYLGESADRHSKDLQTQHGSIHNRLNSLEQKFGEELADVREHLNGEKQLRAQHHDAVAEHLESERRARDGHERAVQQHLNSEKKARETHERLVNEQFAHEKSVRERHHEHVQDLMSREKEAREKHLGMHQEFLQRESAAREAANREIHEILGKDRTLRDQHQQAHQETLQREKSARQRIEDLIDQEMAERSRHHETVNERVDSLQRTVNIFDTLIRKEMDERSRENKRVWDAIDNHTHDLSTQVVEVESGRRETVHLDAVAGSTPQASATPLARSTSNLHRQPPSQQPSGGTGSAPVAWASTPGPSVLLEPATAVVTPAVTMPGPPVPMEPTTVPAPAAACLGPAAPAQRVGGGRPAYGAFAPGAPQAVGFAPRVVAVPGVAGPPTATVAVRQPLGNQAAVTAAGNIFDQLDTNHDGVISRAEFNQLLGTRRP